MSEALESRGPWPFTTRRTFRLPDSSLIVWRSRHHRKGLPALTTRELDAFGARLANSLWMPANLNWWIGIVFALGASLFVVASALSLIPPADRASSLHSGTIDAIFFAGSIPFTTAAYLQLFQAANSQEFTLGGIIVAKRTAFFGWQPQNIGWLSCALQLLGTLLFNFNTLDAMIPNLDWLQQDLEIWAPDLLGSVLFLVSGYLAFAETCHAHFAWKPENISWWVTFINLLGCLAFMVSAVYAFIPPEKLLAGAQMKSTVFTLVGAIGFVIGSLLMLPETAQPVQDTSSAGS